MLKKNKLLIVILLWIIYAIISSDWINVLALIESILVILIYTLFRKGKITINIIYIFWLSYLLFSFWFKYLTW